jgi:hypothetical protein
MANAKMVPAIHFGVGKHTHITVVDPNESMTSSTDVKDNKAVGTTDSGQTITFKATKLSVSKAKMRIQLEGQGRAEKSKGDRDDSGTLTVTLTDPTTMVPTVNPVPVDFVN